MMESKTQSTTQQQQRDLHEKIITELDEQNNIFADFKLNRESIGDSYITHQDRAYHMLKDFNNLINFRRAEVTVGDNPSVRQIQGSGWPRLLGYWWYKLLWKFPDFLQPHYDIRIANDKYKFAQEYNLDSLLLANPISTVGSPLCLEKHGVKFTRKWIQHVYLLSLFKKYLEPYIGDIKVVMDIGSGYGVFSYLIERNYPHTHHILVDLPEQNATAHYYLKSELPDCRIASFGEIQKVDTITRDFVDNYDFILVPCFYLEKLEAGLVDLVTNFISFNEMSREWLDFYLQSDVFNTSKFLFTVNRISKEQNPGIKISILDMPLYEYELIHFDTCPFFNRLSYRSESILGIPYKATKVRNEPIYEFIGKSKKNE